MSTLLLVLQLFAAHPVVSAYAAQVRGDVAVSVTFAEVRPSKVCTYFYDIEDVDMVHATDAHCWAPKTDIGSLDLWPKVRLDDGNFKVVFSYPNRPDEAVLLVAIVNT